MSVWTKRDQWGGFEASVGDALRKIEEDTFNIQ
jgi:hypothetical protein